MHIKLCMEYNSAIKSYSTMHDFVVGIASISCLSSVSSTPLCVYAKRKTVKIKQYAFCYNINMLAKPAC